MRPPPPPTLPKPSPHTSHLYQPNAPPSLSSIPTTSTRKTKNATTSSKMSIRDLLNTLPQRERETGREIQKCQIRAKRTVDRRLRRLNVVFKRSEGRKGDACGMVDCGICGAFWRMEVEDLERRVPGLVSGQEVLFKVMPSLSGMSTPSSVSTLTEFSEREPSSDSSVGSSTPLTELSDHSQSFNPSSLSSLVGSLTPFSLSTLTEFSERGFSPDMSSQSSAIGMPTLFSISTLTEFSEEGESLGILDHSTPFLPSTPSSMSTLTELSDLGSPFSSSSTSTISPNTHATSSIPQQHRSMTVMSDGSEWLPPTLERINAYISSQSTRQLSPSVRDLVVKKARLGSRVALEFENEILKVEMRVSREDRAVARSKRLKLSAMEKGSWEMLG